MQPTRKFSGSTAKSCGLRLITEVSPQVMSAPINRSSPVGRIFIDRKTLHVHDVAAELETEFPESREAQRRLGIRTILGTPLLREDVPLGVIGLRRMEVRPFTEQQIKLLEDVCVDQAVIAIENVRLFQELKESLEQQTATSEILGCYRQLANGYSAGTGHSGGTCGAAL